MQSIYFTEDCYFVRAYYNNDQMKLPGCKKLDCTFAEFENYISDISMTYDQIQDQCYKED